MRRYLEKGGKSVEKGCSLFGKSRQAYYKSLNATSQKRSNAADVVEMVDNTRRELSMPRLGARKLYFMLHDTLEGMGVGRDKFLRILRANHRLVVPKRSYKITTNSHHRFHKHKDAIADLTISRPEQVWVSDITYIGSRNRHCYLALITDAYSKKIVGYDLSNSLCTEGSVRALKMAIKNRSYKEPLIHHSDRGLQYCSDDYQEVLTKRKIKVSMTEKYDPYANAIAERVNGILKQEFLLEEYSCPIEILKKIVDESVATYNTKRPHLSCYMLTPEQMHKQQELKRVTYRSKPKSANGLQAIC